MEKLYNLSNQQKNIWYIEKFYKHTSINNIVGYLRIERNANVSALEKALNVLVKRHDSYRICFKTENGSPVQYVKPYEYVNVEIIDLKNKHELEYFEKSFPKEPIIKENVLAFKAKILRFKKQNMAILVLNVHHLITDAWSMSITLNEIYDNYNKIINNTEVEETEAPSYIDYLNNNDKYLLSTKFEKDKTYWESYFETIPNIVSFKDANNKISNDSNREVFTINEVLSEKINSYCEKNGLSVYIFFLAVYSIYFRNILNVNNFVIANPILNRANKKEKETTGMFVSIMPFIINVLENTSFEEYAKSIASGQMQMYRHLRYPFDDIINDLRKKHNISGEIYDIVFSYQNSDIPDFCKWLPNYNQVESLQIHLKHLNLKNNNLSIHYDYLTDIFSKEDINSMHLRIISIINNILAKKNINTNDIELLTNKEIMQFQITHNQTTKLYPKSSNIVKQFEKIVKRYPNNIAVQDKETKLTYKQLNNYANILAKKIIDSNIQTQNIAFSLKRNVNIYVAILAVLKAGKTFVPIDPDYPIERIKYMLKNSNIEILISTKEFAKLVDFEGSLLQIEDIDFTQTKNNLNINIPSNSICYTIYTSGSTGIPKAVQIKHYNVLNFAYAMQKKLNYHPLAKQKAISLTTVCFDIFIFETFVSLLSGITVFIADELTCRNPKLLSQTIDDFKITKILTTPSRINLLFIDNKYVNSLKKIQEIILGGEPFTENLLKSLKNVTSSNIYNLYGPTETCVYSTFKDLTNTNEITIGTPIANTQVYILNENKKIMPDKSIGEIAIGGDGVGGGYYNDQEKTKKAFIKNPYGNNTIYLTGDLGYYNNNKELVCLGRKDHQIKVRGYRIELNDISNNILKFDGISKCTVIDGEKNGKQYLVAYYTTTKKVDKLELLKYLNSNIPNYMIPNYFIELDDLPLTLNHKVDRSALPEPTKENVILEEFVSPQSKTEKILHKLIRQELGLSRLSVTYDLFNYNIDSLDIISIQTKLLDENIKLNTQDFYKYRTVKKLAEKIDLENVDIEQNYSDELITVNNSFLKHKNGYAELQTNNYETVLITGITGYLGIHILNQFLDNSKSKIIAVVRDKNGVSGNTRLKELYKFYFNKKLPLGRITIINTDITKKNLGLNKELYNRLSSKINLIINCAANVHYYGEYEDFKKINIDVPDSLSDFCMQKNIKLVHISTMGVSGNYLVNKEKGFTNFSEDDFFIGQHYNDNIYIQTKFEAEKLLYEKTKNGLNASIIRVGNLTGRFSDGHFQKNISENAFYNILRIILKYRMLPNTMLSQFLEFTPIDLCSNAIYTIITNVNTDRRVFNVFNQNYLSAENLLNILKLLNINVDVISGNEFKDNILKLTKEYPEENILKGVVNDIDNKEGLSFSSTINQQNFATNYYLENSNFVWPIITKDYLNKIIEYIRKNKYI